MGFKLKTSKGNITRNERVYEAVRLRKTGASFEQIAAKMAEEYGATYDRKKAWADVDYYLNKLATETASDARELRELELMRLDGYLLALQPQIIKGDNAAIDRAIKICDRRCKMLGLDAPVRLEIDEGVAIGVEAELRDFLESLRAVLDGETYFKVLQAFNSLQDRSLAASSN